MHVKAVSSTDLLRFREHGWLVFHQLMDPVIRQQALKQLDRLDGQDEVAGSYEAEYEPVASGRRRLRKLRRLVWTDPTFWGPVLKGAKADEVAEEVIGPNAAIIFHAAFLKPAEVGTEVALHQDQALWSREYPGAFSLWYALSPVTEDNGCLVGCPGTHRNGLIQHRDYPEYPWHPSLNVDEDALPKAVRMPLQAGDAAMWDRYFVHGSEPNRSKMDRRGMVVVFAAASAPGFKPIDHFLLRDLPDYPLP